MSCNSVICTPMDLVLQLWCKIYQAECSSIHLLLLADASGCNIHVMKLTCCVGHIHTLLADKKRTCDKKQEVDHGPGMLQLRQPNSGLINPRFFAVIYVAKQNVTYRMKSTLRLMVLYL